MSEAKYKRVLLKLSGEALAGEQKTGIDANTVGNICDKIKMNEKEQKAKKLSVFFIHDDFGDGAKIHHIIYKNFY